MFDYDSEYDEEYDEEEYDMSQSCEVKENNGVITVDINVEAMKNALKRAVMDEIASDMRKSIMDELRNTVIKDLRDGISNAVNETVKGIVENVFDTGTVTIGGSWGEKSEELSYRDFTAREIKRALDSGRITDGSGYSNRTYSITEYFKEKCINDDIKKQLNKYIEGIRNDINMGMKEMFDQKTRETLSSLVLDTLLATDTYRKIEENMRYIAGK